MEIQDFTVEHLKRLPLRANVAFAVRCARRVEHLAQLPDGHPERERRREAVAAALRMAEAFARGSNAPPDESIIAAVEATRDGAGGPPGNADAVAAAAEAAHATACAWLSAFEDGEEAGPPETGTADAQKFLSTRDGVTAELAALDALTAAEDALTAVGYGYPDFFHSVLNDYNLLIGLKAGRYPDLGRPIDPAPEGPLGAL